MNKTKQFWTLVKFQFLANPAIWFMAAALITPNFVTSSMKYTSLDLLLGTSNLFLVFIFGMWMLFPEAMQRNPAATGLSPTEFLLTRAVDRCMLNRARVVVFYVLLLIIPIGMWIYSFGHPDVQVFAFKKNEQELILSRFPGSALIVNEKTRMADFVSIPGGNSLIKLWILSAYLLFALSLQVLALLVQGLKHRSMILWTLYIVILMSMMGMPFLGILANATNQISGMESMFLIFTAHQTIWWLAVLAGFVLCQIWCERRFVNMEQ